MSTNGIVNGNTIRSCIDCDKKVPYVISCHVLMSYIPCRRFLILGRNLNKNLSLNIIWIIDVVFLTQVWEKPHCLLVCVVFNWLLFLKTGWIVVSNHHHDRSPCRLLSCKSSRVQVPRVQRKNDATKVKVRVLIVRPTILLS